MYPEIVAAFATVAHLERLAAARNERRKREVSRGHVAHAHRPASRVRLVARIATLRGGRAPRTLTPATSTTAA